jgi:hypothetical protein
MFVKAQKDHYEKENEEAERLVRPAPKVKPSRHDKKREILKDPDLESDPDLKGDKDLSLNFKTIGGSDLSARVVLKFANPKDWVKVRNKQKDVVTRVAPNTLKEEPEVYQRVPKNEPHQEEGIRPPRRPSKPKKPYIHKEHIPHPPWPEPRPIPPKPRPVAKPPTPPKRVKVPVPPTPEKQPKPKPPGWVPRRRDLKAFNVVSKFLSAKETEKVLVRKKDTGWVGEVSKDTFKESPSTYEAVEKGEEAPKKEDSKEEVIKKPSTPKPEKKDSEKTPEEVKLEQQTYDFEVKQQLKDLDDPKAESILKSLTNPKHENFKLWRAPHMAKMPASTLLPGVVIPGVDTIGDLIRVLETKKPIKIKAPKPGSPPKVEEEKPKEAPKPDTQGDAKGETTPPKDGEEKPKDETTPPKGGEEKPKGGKAPPEGKKPSKEPKKEEIKTPPRPKPERRTISDEERSAHVLAIARKYPPEIALKLISSNIHPDDMAEIEVEMGETHKHLQIPTDKAERDAFLKEKRSLVQSDPDKIGPPAFQLGANGEQIAYADLPPDQQQEAWADHRNKVLAFSLSLENMLFDSYKEKGLPESIASRLATRDTKGEETVSSEEIFSSFKDSLKSDDAGEWEHLTKSSRDEKISELFEAVKGDTDAEALLTSHFQAFDYKKAREKYLDVNSDSAINEKSNPQTIAYQVREAMKFLRKEGKKYPPSKDGIDPANEFWFRVINRMQTLKPEKVDEIIHESKKMDEVLRKDLEERKKGESKKLEKQFKAEEAAYKLSLLDYQQGYRKAPPEAPKSLEDRLKEFEDENQPEVATPHEKPKPKKPFKKKEEAPKEEAPKQNNEEAPKEEALKQNNEEAPKQNNEEEGTPKPEEGSKKEEDPKKEPPRPKHNDQRWRLKDGPKKKPKNPNKEKKIPSEPKDKKAHRVVKAYFSSCEKRNSMGNRKAVYWGIDPMENYPKAHPEWSTANPSNLSDKDLKAILDSAKQWLKNPILEPVEGLYKDTQLRAALDLAIRDTLGGKYSSGMHPRMYNHLLQCLVDGKSKDLRPRRF